MRFRFSALLIVLASVSAHAQLAAPHVRISQGELEGEVSTMGPLVFKGIPYAAPPVGDLRWREPKPAAGMDRRPRRDKVRSRLHAAGIRALMGIPAPP